MIVSERRIITHLNKDTIRDSWDILSNNSRQGEHLSINSIICLDKSTVQSYFILNRIDVNQICPKHWLTPFDFPHTRSSSAMPVSQMFLLFFLCVFLRKFFLQIPYLSLKKKQINNKNKSRRVEMAITQPVISSAEISELS